MRCEDDGVEFYTGLVVMVASGVYYVITSDAQYSHLLFTVGLAWQLWAMYTMLKRL